MPDRHGPVEAEETRAQQTVTLWRWRGDPAAPGGPNPLVGPPGPWNDPDGRTIPDDNRIEQADFIPASELERFAERVAGELEARAEQRTEQERRLRELATPAHGTANENRAMAVAYRDAASLLRSMSEGGRAALDSTPGLSEGPPDKSAARRKPSPDQGSPLAESDSTPPEQPRTDHPTPEVRHLRRLQAAGLRKKGTRRCPCGYEGPDEFGNYYIVADPNCPVHAGESRQEDTG